jgi:hypothetical protein
MANGDDDPRVYQALMLPEQALEKGGAEILRIGLIEDELYISARPILKNPAQWGEVLGEAARRLGAIYAAQDKGLSRKDIIVQIAEAFAADMGAKPVKAETAAKPAKKAKAVKPPARRTAKPKKR